MSILCRPAVAVPEHTISLEETLELARRLHPRHDQLPLVLRLITNTGVRKRHLAQPINETKGEITMRISRILVLNLFLVALGILSAPPRLTFAASQQCSENQAKITFSGGSTICQSFGTYQYNAPPEVSEVCSGNSARAVVTVAGGSSAGTFAVKPGDCAQYATQGQISANITVAAPF